MPVRHIHIIRQRRPRQRRTDAAQINHPMRHTQALGAKPGEIQLLGMALSVVERQKPRQILFGGDLVGKRDGIQPA